MNGLQDLPVKDGFRLRGLDMTRLETFVDAAFAFAITMLVISQGKIPQNYSELIEALKATPAFLFSFILIMMIWIGHRKWSRRFGLEDAVTTVLSLALVFVMLVYVIPLRLMASAFLNFASGGYLPSEFSLEGGSDLAGLFVVYGFGSFAMSLALALLYLRGKKVEELELNALELARTDEEIAGWMTMAATGLVSALLGWLAPTRIAIWAGFVYPTLCVSMPLVSRVYARRSEEAKRALQDR